MADVIARLRVAGYSRLPSEDGRDVGRLYEDRHSKPELRLVLVDHGLRQPEARHAAAFFVVAKQPVKRGQPPCPGEEGPARAAPPL
jgi:hypothetical protein